MNKILKTLMAVIFVSGALLGQDAPPEKPVASLKSANKKFLYIGFEKATSETQRQSILNKASSINIEELTLLEYPLFRMEFAADDEGIRSFNEAYDQLKNETGVMFVSDKQNWDNSDFKNIGIKRQGKMKIPDEKKLPASSKANYHRIILNHMPGLNRCVVKAYPIEKRPKIKALYEIVVNKKGAVKGVRLLSSNIKKPSLRGCLKQKILSWHDFPRRSENENYTVKFKFSY
ncbi:MAG: hypothetical protein P8X42_00390 [Calditrichaceae bacterium]|jgi:hypothetical protein